MSTIAFAIKPSPDTNDHEVRVLVDGRDVLDKKYMGVDPREFFAQFAKYDGSYLLIGRCLCGVLGCCDYPVAVEVSPAEVVWRGRGLNLSFDRAQYEEAVRSASGDFSWEDQKRRAERLVGDILEGCQTTDGLVFQWASARKAPKFIRLSFGRAGKQKILEFEWDEATDDSAMLGATRLKRQLLGA